MPIAYFSRKRHAEGGGKLVRIQYAWGSQSSYCKTLNFLAWFYTLQGVRFEILQKFMGVGNTKRLANRKVMSNVLNKWP